MAYIVLTQASSGAPTCNGVNGSVTAIMRWGLAQKSWAEEYGGGSGNAAVFRAATGNRHRVQINHDSASSGAAQRCIIRGAENASSATSLTDPFPLTSIVADSACNVLASTTADSTARNYYLIVDDAWFLFLVQINGSVWDGGFFGDPPGIESGDGYGTCLIQRNNAAQSGPTSFGAWATSTANFGLTSVHWARDRSGATKSTHGNLFAASSWGGYTNGVAARSGYANRVRREKVGILCTGAQSNTANSMVIDRRGWLPCLWSPLHNGIGTLSGGDTMTDTAYNASASFTVLSTTGSKFALLETTTTWAAPGV